MQHGKFSVREITELSLLVAGSHGCCYWHGQLTQDLDTNLIFILLMLLQIDKITMRTIQ